MKVGRFAGFLLFGILGISVSLAAQSGSSPGTAYHAQFRLEPRNGNECVVTLPERGWYGFRLKSDTGAAFTLIDRMAGAIASDGVRGSRDGRVDLLLEPGEYKAVLGADSPAAELFVDEYRELSGIEASGEKSGVSAAEPSFLLDGDSVSSELGDFQLRSYWLEVKEDEALELEAMGRNLSSLSLWQDGRWKTDVALRTEKREAEAGKPMNYFEIAQKVPAGIYLLRCVGGRELPWPEEDGTNPYYIRRGVEYRGERNILRHVVSPFGTDFYLVSAKADYFRLSRAEVGPAGFSIGSYSPGRSRYAGVAQSASITEKSKQPVCTIRRSFRGDRLWLALTGKPGDELLLSWFKKSGGESLVSGAEGGDFWISSVPTVDQTAMIDQTAIVGYEDTKNRQLMVEAHKTVRLSSDEPYVRRINLFSEQYVLVTVTEAGTYAVAESEKDACPRRATASFRCSEALLIGI